ncbi:MAG: T9SS type A sorting domain-containing protein, partial [Bacteroidetes bacterium]|nr:T9SS type A sorting domain-containing protein [Bacteroidota bacterium]
LDPSSGRVLVENYIAEYGYPDYVNSDVRTVKDVADMAYNAYTGRPPVLPLWPEDNPPDGIYQVPAPPPAPIVMVTNNDRAHSVLRWGRAQESFAHPRLTGPVVTYRVQRSHAAIGPWQTLAEIPVGSSSHLTEADLYEFIDTETTVGESQWYAVTSMDAQGNESGKTNLMEVVSRLGATETLGEVHAVPNPFHLNSGFATGGGENSAQQIGFYGLPSQATIEIYSYSGQLIDTIEHDAAQYSTPWFQVTRNDQEIASGVYFFVVRTPEGETYRGKFVVIK